MTRGSGNIDPAFVLLFNATAFPRDAMLLAAIDVIAAGSDAAADGRP